MQISQTGEYALRAMTCLALNLNQDPLSAKALALSTKIPVHYLSKVLRKLVEAGFIISKKGHGGGFVLAKDANDISFKEILETVDSPLGAAVCVFGWEKCGNENPCPLHFAWSNLKLSFTNWASSKNLNDVIIANKQNLACNENKKTST